MAFGLQKLAVLESKLSIYEDLSKEMLDKLERAVASISENSNRVAIILERHENRLEESDRADAAILQMVERLENRVTKIDEKVASVQKNVIIGGAILTTIITFIQLLPSLGLTLTQKARAATIGSAEMTHVLPGDQIR